MNQLWSLFLGFCCACSLASNEFACAHLSQAPVDSAQYRKYAPDRSVDILHVLLDVTPDFQERSVSGTMTMTFKTLVKRARELRLHAIDLRVREVTSTADVQAWQNTGEEIIVTYKNDIPADQETKLTINYSAYPKKGMYFRTVGMGFKPEDEQLFTQGEDIEARHWFPTHDFPNEKFTSEIICHLPEAMTALANGKLLDESTSGGKKTVRWLQDKPHTAYLICLVAGRLKGIKDTYKNIELGFYTPESDIEYAKNSFQDTKDMMAFFEKEIGFDYPWAKYYQACVRDFMWGGMENTSLTTLTDATLHPDETENIRSSQGLVAHELAHQWFGDLVTCKDWSHLWLNEGFATYYSALYTKHKDGLDDFRHSLYTMAKGFINRSVSEDSRPIVFRRYDNAVELFGYLVYPKGAWVLHMLRTDLGEDLFRKVVKTYLERHQFDTVVTSDLIAVVEEVSGKSYDQFFDQWVFHPHHPELQVNYSWDERAKLARISITQVQQLTNDVALFRFPLKVRFRGDFGTEERELTVSAKQEDFYLPLPSAPKMVRLDPELSLLAKITFEPPRPLLLEQLKDSQDMIGRLLAVQQLGKGRDSETLRLLQDTLNKDSFYAVRMEAADQLRAMQSEPALKALLASASQEDARVRQHVLIQIGRFYDSRVLDHALAQLETEKNPDVLHHAITTLNTSTREKSGELLVRFLMTNSFRNILADAAVTAIRGQNDPAYIPDLIKVLSEREQSFLAPGYASALDTLAYLARHEEDKSQVRDFLLARIHHSRERIRVGAINALNTLQDPTAIAPLQKIASGSRFLPSSDAAEKAVASLRSGRKPVDEFHAIRTELQELKKQNRDLTKTVEDLKKKLEAAPAPASPPSPAKRSPTRRGKSQ